MMPAYCILIVEDQIDVRNMLRSGLETLGPEFEVVATPSGEEAFLELTRHRFDLLIADVRLAGMSGIELRTKALNLNPEMKVILITGVSDPNFRRQVAESGADAFFFKPIVMKRLFATVKGLLELERTGRQPGDEESSKIPHSSTAEIVERLASLRDEHKAISAVLLHANGDVTASVGPLPDAAIKSDLVPMFSRLLSTGTKVSQLLDKQAPEDLYCISGHEFNFSMTHVNSDHSLLVVTNRDPEAEYFGNIGLSMHVAALDISDLLTQSSPVSGFEIPEADIDLVETITDNEHQDPLPEADLSETTVDEEPQEALPDVEDIFHTKDGDNLSPDDIDAFWDSALEEGNDSYIPTSDALSYNEARQRGITPDGDEH